MGSGIEVQVGEIRLPGRLVVPDGPLGLVLFAHGSGSSHRSPRNRAVADRLADAGLATLLFDLLTDAEAADRAAVFDIGLLGSRLQAAMRFLEREHPGPGALPRGLFGASTGAAAALWAAAADPGGGVAAVVSRGGRPDLAGARLGSVTAPTLLIVGERDEVVLDLNRRAGAALGGPWALEVVPGAGHLFEGPGMLEQVADLAAVWFREHLAASGPPETGRRL
jgi:dienelactone hydrolase